MENYGNEQNAILVIDSKNKVNPSETSTKFTYKSDQLIDRIQKVKVDSLYIPFTFYTITTKNNTLTFNSAAKTVTVTPGNYNGTTLASALQTAIGAAYVGETVTVNISTTTYLMTITKTNPFIVDATSSLAPYIGFTVSSASGTSATGNAAINIAGPKYLSLVSKFLTKNLMFKTSYSNKNYRNILAIIPINASPGGIISYSQDFYLNYAGKFSIKDSDIIDISINDDAGNVIDLNGLETNIVLNFVLA